MTFDAQTKAMHQMASAAVVVRAFASSDSARALIALLDALIASYLLDLLHVTPDSLVRVQAAIKQAQAIRAVVADESTDIPKI